MPGPYYLECPNHDLCGFGHIERLLLKKSGIDIYLNRSDLSPNQRSIHVYYEFTGSELVEVRKILITIVSGYQCFVDET